MQIKAGLEGLWLQHIHEIDLQYCRKPSYFPKCRTKSCLFHAYSISFVYASINYDVDSITSSVINTHLLNFILRILLVLFSSFTNKFIRFISMFHISNSYYWNIIMYRTFIQWVLCSNAVLYRDRIAHGMNSYHMNSSSHPWEYVHIHIKLCIFYWLIGIHLHWRLHRSRRPDSVYRYISCTHQLSAFISVDMRK